MTIIATYRYQTSSTAARAALLDEHLAFIQELEGSGKLLAAGKVEGIAWDILFLIDSESTEEVRELLTRDPFYTAGHIAALDVSRWEPRRGRLAPL